VSFSALFVCICVLNYCHRVAAQLQLNIPYHIIITFPCATIHRYKWLIQCNHSLTAVFCVVRSKRYWLWLPVRRKHVEMTLLVLTGEVPGSITKFVCFLSVCMNGTLATRGLGLVALLLTEVPNPDSLLSFQWVYLQWSKIFDTRYCLSVNSACAVASQYRQFRTMLWNFDQTWSVDMAYHSTERRLLREGVALWTQVTSFLQGNNKPSSLYLLGISTAASMMSSNPTFS